MSAKLQRSLNGYFVTFLGKHSRCTHVQDFSENKYGVAGLEQPIDICDYGNLGQVFDHCEFQNMYIDIGGGDDDSVEAALGLIL